MKKLSYLFLALITLTACQKAKLDNLSASNGTGSIYQSQLPDPFIVQGVSENRIFTGQDSLIAIGLMNSNNLSINGYRLYAYQYYNALNQNNQLALYQLVLADQVRNDLPVFSQEVTFGFENGVLNGPPPTAPFIAGNIALNNKPTLSLKTLRDTFVKVDNAREATNLSIKDSTLVAQLGYYNTNLGFPDQPVNFIKVWRVRPQHLEWPQGYFRDDNGATISFTPLTHSGPQAP